MKFQIEDYITEIRLKPEFDYRTAEFKETFTFYGDGSGDFQESSSKATKEVLERFIEFCNDQKSRAEKAIARLF